MFFLILFQIFLMAFMAVAVSARPQQAVEEEEQVGNVRIANHDSTNGLESESESHAEFKILKIQIMDLT